MKNSSQSVPTTFDHFHMLILNVGYARHRGDWNWKQVNSPFNRIYCVTAGSAVISLPQGQFELLPGNLYFIPAFTTHDCLCTKEFEHFYIHAYEDLYPVNSITDSVELPVCVQSTPVDQMLFERLVEINPSMQLPQSNPQSYDNRQTLMESVQKNRERALGVRMESRGILYQIVSRFLYSATPRKVIADFRICRAVTFIMQHLDKQILIPELAAAACLSTDHFSRIFNTQIGESPLKFILRKKIERAQLLLVTDSLPIKSIAYNLGFDDFSYFNRIFKKYTGITPKTYRNQFK